MTALAPHLSAYLREHLPRERAVSPHTVKTYANCFVLLVQFAADRLKRRPTDLEIEDPQILQGMLESSNVNSITEMTRMITVQRAYEIGRAHV